MSETHIFAGIQIIFCTLLNSEQIYFSTIRPKCKCVIPLSRGSFAQPAVWRPGRALDLASQWPGTRDEPLSMRGECAICGRGAEFSTGLSATLA